MTYTQKMSAKQITTLKRFKIWYMKNIELWYIFFKFIISVPPVVIGNVLDLLSFGTFKRIIDISPLMEKRFFGVSSKTRENRASYPNSYLDKGFAGGLRLIMTSTLEIGIKLISAILALLAGLILEVISAVVYG